MTSVNGANSGGAIVRFEVLDEAFMATRRGVYLVTAGGTIVYCGTFTVSFAKRWVYTRHKYVYHFKRNIIAEALEHHDMRDQQEFKHSGQIQGFVLDVKQVKQLDAGDQNS